MAVVFVEKGEPGFYPRIDSAGEMLLDLPHDILPLA